MKKHRVERHHRVPRSRGGSDHTSNISIVRATEHRAFHHLFGNMTAPEIAAMLTDTWIGDYYLVAIPYKKKRPKKRRVRRYCTSCQAEVLKTLPATKENADDQKSS